MWQSLGVLVEPYDLLIVLVIVFWVVFGLIAIPRKVGKELLDLKGDWKSFELEILTLPNTWIRASLMLDTLNNALRTISIASSVVVIVLLSSEDPSVQKGAFYTMIALVTSLCPALGIERRAAGYRQAFTMLKGATIAYKAGEIPFSKLVEEYSDAEKTLSLAHGN